MMTIDTASKTTLKKAARGWKPYGVLGAKAVARIYSCRSIVELVTGTTFRDVYLGEFDTMDESREYARKCNRFMQTVFAK